MPRSRFLFLTVVVLAGLVSLPAFAQTKADDSTKLLQDAELTHVGMARVVMPVVDIEAVAAEDLERELEGLAPRYAIPNEVRVTPAASGTWESTDEGMRVWRLQISSPGTLSLNLGFTRYFMPPGGQMLLYATDGSYQIRPLTEADNENHGELWTPVVLSDDITVEVTIPQESVDQLDLELAVIGVGYRGFADVLSNGPRSGTCNNDVICPEGDGWRDEIPSVAVISTGGSLFCTGFMVNNTAEDQTHYFMTANHCGITSSNDSSLVVYWNFESPTCGQQGGGSLGDWQSGSYWRSAYSSSDFTLVELDDDPNEAWGVTFAGWNRSTANPTSAVAIHHPSCDEKSISFENQACTTTSYLGTTSPGDGTHIRVIDWDDGTTEPGSSGSPLFDQNHRVVGQLHGGYAACGNDESDWYGRFSKSWTGGGSSSSRLSDWLDPGSTGATSVDTLVPGAAGLKVTPSSGLDSSGDPGGPFTPDSVIYTLENQGDSGINYNVTHSESWVSVSNASGYLAGYATTNVTVSINSNADSLGVGVYTDTVNFINTTTHEGDTSRIVTLQVGGPSLAYSFPMNSNPGWTTQGLWAFGQPTGIGGEHGGPDPTSGYTGTNVYGYNLNGDYENYLSERHLTSTAIDCSNLGAVTLKFRRWLGVERSLYDHAYVRVSNNGSSWTTVWENGVEVTDSSWSLQEFDISLVADGQATVYLRWTMGTTDSSYRYCGWNIDDVEIWGISQEEETCDDGILNQGEDRIDCGGPCPPCECTSDGMCDNGAFCDGEETCDDYGYCQDGTFPCTNPAYPYCDEGQDDCDECAENLHCDDGEFCNGAETCIDGSCQDGTFPCTNPAYPYCDEGQDDCDECAENLHCDDDAFCNGAETCVDGSCYPGDDPCPGQECDEEDDVCVPITVKGDCDEDGDVDLQDFLAFQGCYTGPGGSAAPGCECVDFNDDGDVDLADFLEFQSAFTGPG